MRRKINLIGVLGIVILSGCVNPFLAYQQDADIYRMHHLENYGALIKEYHEKTGKYPFEGITKKDIHVAFVTPDQATGNEVYEDENVLALSQEDFRQEISRALGREIRLWFNPQRVMTNSPLYYLYVLEKDTYFFVIHLGLRYPFAAYRDSGFSQIEISNRPKEYPGFWKYEDIIVDSDFRKHADAIPSRTAWLDSQNAKQDGKREEKEDGVITIAR